MLVPKSYNHTLAVIFASILAVSLSCGCKKLVEVEGPPTSTSSLDMYTSDATAASVLTGIYTKMAAASLNTSSKYLTMLSLYSSLSADELTLTSGVSGAPLQYYTNSLNNTTLPNVWTATYPVIYIANSAIDGLQKSTSLTPAVKQQLLGEAKFIRAFHYFYLVNLYGDVPIVLTTDYTVNATLPRSPQADVYAQIIADLKDAQTLLSPNFLKADALTTSTDRLRPTSWAATALLARVYLYLGQWANAEQQATTVLNNSSTFALNPSSSIGNTFLKAASSNLEPIWQLQPVNTGWNTEEARVFVLPLTGPSTSYPVYLSTRLLTTFEPNDARRKTWVDSVIVSGSGTYYYPKKYKSATLNAGVTEYSTVLRTAELVLIRAEARAKQDNLSATTGALADVNLIRTHANIGLYSGATDKTSILNEIMHQRQDELFTEWGQRWLDLKRTGAVDSVMSVVTPLKGGTWKSSWQWYPVALSELNTDPNLKQNTDY